MGKRIAGQLGGVGEVVRSRRVVAAELLGPLSRRGEIQGFYYLWEPEAP